MREMNKEYYSINDKLEDLKASPAALTILSRVMDLIKNTAGQEVGEKISGLLEGTQGDSLSFETLCKYAGGAVTKEQLDATNDALQKIRKPLDVEYNEAFPLTADAAKTNRVIYDCIHSGEPIYDTHGYRIQTHGGAVYFEDGVYYWYGENKNRTDGKNGVWTWGMKMYKSTDLYNWEELGYFIPPEYTHKNSGMYPEKHADRPHILKSETTGKYVCWIKQSGEEACFLILQSDALQGPYEVVKEEYRPFGHKVGDFDMIRSKKDGKVYLFMDADHKGIYGYCVSEDLLSLEEEISRQYEDLYAPFTREAVALFERGDKIYMLTSGMSGYIPNKSDLAVTDDWKKPFVSIGDPHVGDETKSSFNSQISQVFQVAGKEDFYISIGDRWVPDYPVDAHRADLIERSIAAHYAPEKYQVTEEEKRELMDSPMLGSANTSKADYVWLPVEFKEDQPCISWKDTWTV